MHAIGKLCHAPAEHTSQTRFGPPETAGGGARTTRLTPKAVSAMPATVMAEMGSPNNTQAITAVQGGTRYMSELT